MASRSKIRSGGTSGSDPNAWMVTFGDLIMLLLTFFVLLLTMKSMDRKEVRELFKELSVSSGPLEFIDTGTGEDSSRGMGPEGRPVVIEDSETLQSIFRLLEGVQTQPAEQEKLNEVKRLITVAEDVRGVVITLESDELFDTGGADIRPDRMKLLDGMGRILQKTVNDIIIIGHTDNIPIQSENIRSNWELSAFRAINVYYYLVDHTGMAATRLAVGGFGDQMPLYANDSPEHMAKNRRIEFVLKARDE